MALVRRIEEKGAKEENGAKEEENGNMNKTIAFLSCSCLVLPSKTHAG